MSEAVQIGKFTLESLTTGMYEQPLIVYREYLQNAADSLESAQRTGIVDEKTMLVQIRVSTDERMIEIRDNGEGIPEDLAPSILMSVGKSPKLHTESRGFRGIGRLGGISYCDRLEFETSTMGSDKAVLVSFDCVLLKQLLRPGENADMSMAEVIEKVCHQEVKEVAVEDHYFSVRMLDVDERTNLLDAAKVKSYLGQIAPVTYSPNFKMISDHIYTFLRENNVNLTEFPVQVVFDSEFPRPLVKPCSRRYYAGRGKEQDQEIIYEIEKFIIKSHEQKTLALGWYAKGEWKGTITDPNIRGLRIRMGNIQIGNEDTLDFVFKQPRFNGWCQGEIFAVSDELIPNARRDNFEQNSAYFELIEGLKPIADKIYKELTEASKARNDPATKTVESGKEVVSKVVEQKNKGFNSHTEAETAVIQVESALSKLKKTVAKKPEIEQKKAEVIEQLQGILDDMEDVTPYKRDRLKGVLGKKEMKIFNLATDIMTEYLDEDFLNVIVDKMIDEILK